MLYRRTTSGTDTFGYPYYFFFRFSMGEYVYEHRYYTTEKFRVDYQQDNKATANFSSEWVDGRRMAYYLQIYINGILVDEETSYSIYMSRGPVNNFEILGANYYVTLLDGVTVVYTPQSLAKFERPQLHVYRRNKLKRKRILYRYSAAEERLIPTP